VHRVLFVSSPTHRRCLGLLQFRKIGHQFVAIGLGLLGFVVELLALAFPPLFHVAFESLRLIVEPLLHRGHVGESLLVIALEADPRTRMKKLANSSKSSCFQTSCDVGGTGHTPDATQEGMRHLHRAANAIGTSPLPEEVERFSLGV